MPKFPAIASYCQLIEPCPGLKDEISVEYPNKQFDDSFL
jgi:hypothetical protein